MWLRRITEAAALAPSPSQSPTPSPNPNRTHSPAPNRNPYSLNSGPIQPATGAPSRNVYGERSSSLSALSTGSGRQSRSPSAERPSGSPSSPLHPVAILIDILGSLPRLPHPDLVKKPKFVTEIDFSGLSLHEFVERPPPPPQGNSIVQQGGLTIDDTPNRLSEEQFEDLHHSIEACDKVLQSVESYLTNFQNDLNVVSSEIESLQAKSMDLVTRTENRERVKKLLIPAIEASTLAPALVKTIVEGPIDGAWISALAELDRHERRGLSIPTEERLIKCVEEVEPLMEKLMNKAVERIKDHLVAQIKFIRAPGANAQMIQQRGFIRFKDLHSFLFRRNRELANSLTKAYVNTMKWYYLSNFSRYSKALEKINLYAVDKHSVIGNTDEFSKKTTKVTNGKFTASQYDPFSIGRRIDVIKNPSPTAISSYVAEEDNNHHYLEVPFYAFNLALIDNASYEYSFLTELYSGLLTHHEISRLFSNIFDATFSVGQSVTTRLSSSTFDSIGLLLAIRINQTFAFELQRRKVPTMDDYINLTNIVLWPRFQQVMDQHCESIKKVTASISARSTTVSLLSGTGGGSNGAISTAPIPLTQRFGTFLYALLSLSNDASDAEPLVLSLSRLRTEFDHYLAKMGRGLADKKQTNRFLTNNYQLIMTITGSVDNPLADQTKAHFTDLLAGLVDEGTTGS